MAQSFSKQPWTAENVGGFSRLKDANGNNLGHIFDWRNADLIVEFTNNDYKELYEDTLDLVEELREKIKLLQDK